MRHEHFQVTRPVGTGHSRENDVRRIRRALHETGYITALPDPSGQYNAGAIAAIERFQRDHGLKEDGVILPGGPTERVLELSLAARREGGADSQKQLRDLLRNAAEAGLAFLPGGADDDRPGVFVDRDGEFASPERLRELLTPRNDDGTRGDEVQVANAAAAAVRGLPLAADGIAALSLSPTVARILGVLGGPALVLGAQRAADEWLRLRAGDPEMQKEREHSLDAATEGLPDLHARHAAARDRARAARMPAESGPTILPGKSLEPPKLEGPKGPPPAQPKPEDFIERYPASPAQPTLLISPIPEEGKPEIEVYPDMSNEFERWLVLENSRGTEKGQQKDLQLIIDMFYEKLRERGIGFKHLAGGRTEDGEYKKERVYKSEQETLKGSRRPDVTFEWESDNKTVDLNVQDMNRSGKTATKRERDAEAALRRLQTFHLKDKAGGVHGLPKSKGHNEEDYRKMISDILDAIIDKYHGPKG